MMVFPLPTFALPVRELQMYPLFSLKDIDFSSPDMMLFLN